MRNECYNFCNNSNSLFISIFIETFLNATITKRRLQFCYLLINEISLLCLQWYSDDVVKEMPTCAVTIADIFVFLLIVL